VQGLSDEDAGYGKLSKIKDLSITIPGFYLAEVSFGVPLSLATSGYILCRPFLGGRQVSLKRYFTRRLSRLEPPYLISLLLVFGAKVALLGVAARELAPNLFASLVYSHNLIYGEHSLVNGVAWSLEIEWQFYLLAPLGFALVARTSGLLRHIGLFALVLVGGFAYGFAREAGPFFALSLLAYFGFFAAGTWIAVLDEDHPETGRDSLWLDVVGVLAWVALLTILLGGPDTRWPLPLLTALLLLTGIRGKFFRRIFGWWPIYCFGAMCYTIYLYHFFVVSAVGSAYSAFVGWPASPGAGLWPFAIVCIPLVLAACMIPYLLIERPFMVWRPGRNRLAGAFGWARRCASPSSPRIPSSTSVPGCANSRPSPAAR